MPSEKEVKFMEKYKAKIIRGENDQTTLSLEIGSNPLDIILTEDKPNDVKNVFNGLLEHLKDGVFEFELESDKKDLYYFISNEYIIQLNAEIQSVFNEMSDYGLLNEEDSE